MMKSLREGFRGGNELETPAGTVLDEAASADTMNCPGFLGGWLV
jgi:hypothetical protein